MSAVASRIVVDDLRGDGPARDAAMFRLRAHLVSVAWFELERRRGQLATLPSAEAARLVRDAAETACATLLSCLDDYHGQSRFLVWTAKFAIHEAAVAARREAAGRQTPAAAAPGPASR
jgi:hypothetical protein